METDAVSSELSKLKKSDLIEILITKKVPQALVGNAVISDIIYQLFPKENLPKSGDNLKEETCNVIECIKNKLENSYLKQEVLDQKHLIYHLEKRVSDQEQINQILNLYNKTNRIDHPTPSVDIINNEQTGAENADEILKSYVKNSNPKEKNIKKAATTCDTLTSTIDAVNTNSGTYDDGFTKVTYKNKRKMQIIKGEKVGKAKIQGVEKYAYVYVGHIKGEVVEKDMLEYLSETWPENSFQVKKLDTKGNNSSFKVSLEFKDKNILFEGTKWPQGVIVKDYKFFRPSANKNNNK